MVKRETVAEYCASVAADIADVLVARVRAADDDDRAVLAWVSSLAREMESAGDRKGLDGVSKRMTKWVWDSWAG